MHERAHLIFDADESPELSRPDFEIHRVSDGLGFGEGAISGTDDPEALALAEETIQHSGKILVAVDRDEDGRVLEDDGCGDGRRTGLIFRFKQFFKRNLNRAKVFGGAVTMTAAGLIGTGRAKDSSLEATFGQSIDVLEENSMEYGAHTDDIAEGENSGCGAIDNAPKIVKAAIKYESQIRETIGALGADTEELDAVYGNFHGYAETLPSDEKYSGRRVMDGIIGAGKVIKQLVGMHREKCIVLNSVRGYTLNQEMVRKRTHGRAEIFGVDVWRLEDIAAGAFPGYPKVESQAYLSELVYTLATAAVLTKGDLPVYMVNDAPQAS